MLLEAPQAALVPDGLRARFDRMLARMFGTAGDGLHDRLLDFLRPVTGAYYFAPSLSMLTRLSGGQKGDEP